MDLIFKALADSNRRDMLDALRDHPGLTVGELSERFPFTRFATMKHLKILEEAGLVLSRREWKTKRLYLNAVPIQQIADRWISRFAGEWAKRLNNLKKDIEE